MVNKAWTFTGNNFSEAPDNQFVTDFLMSYLYNLGNGGGEMASSIAYSGSNHVNVVNSRLHRNEFVKYENYDVPFIYWDPYLAMKTPDGKGHSPATGLEHEFGHAAIFFDKTFPAKEDDAQYENSHERYVIDVIEARQARLNGEGRRYSHGPDEQYKVSDPRKTKMTPELRIPIVNKNGKMTWKKIYY